MNEGTAITFVENIDERNFIMKRYTTPNFKSASTKEKSYRGPCGYKACLIASGLGRMVDHMLTAESWGIVSSHDSKKNDEWQEAGKGKFHPDNRKAHQELKLILQNRGIGYIKAKGAWATNEDIENFIYEESLFIPQVRESFIRALAKKYNQEAYIYGENGKWALKDTVTGDIKYDLSGDVRDDFMQWTPDKGTPDMYTEIGGRQWKFNPSSDPQQDEVLDDLGEDRVQEKIASFNILRDYGTVFYATDPCVYYSSQYGFVDAEKVSKFGSNQVFLPVYNKTRRKK